MQQLPVCKEHYQDDRSHFIGFCISQISSVSIISKTGHQIIIILRTSYFQQKLRQSLGGK